MRSCDSENGCGQSAANGGVLFLDEVGDLGLDEQAMLLRAIEEKRFLPLGSDKEHESDFQLICGTHRDLAQRAGVGLFRDDLLARINLWAFRMPGLRDRSEDIEPNLLYELDRFCARTGGRVSFNKEALRRFLDFATSHSAQWSANFRDLGGAVTRMATLAPGGRISEGVVEEEIDRLRSGWHRGDSKQGKKENDAAILTDVLGKAGAQQLDAFDRVQLAEVLRVCRNTTSLSEAGRVLFAVSREKKKTSNDADRVRKYLMRFGVDYETLKL